MNKPITITNTFSAQTGPIPLSQLDANFTQVVNAINDPATYQNYVVDTGAANAYVVTPNPAWTAYAAGMQIQVLITNANTTASTLNVSGLGAVSVLTESGGAIGAGNIPVGVVSFIHNGTTFRLTAAGVGVNTDITSMSSVTALTRASGIAITGTNTNDSAAVGVIGEYISSTIATGSSVSLSTGVAANITSISLTSGDWDVSGFVCFSFGATTSFTVLIGGASSTSAAVPSATERAQLILPATVPGAGSAENFPLAPQRFSLNTTTTIYLVGSATFTVSTCNGFGRISARRVR